MCRVPVQVRELVKERLAAAAEEIFELLEKTITEYEEHLVFKYEQQRHQGALYTTVGGFPVGQVEGTSEPASIKEEQDLTETQLCSASFSPPTWNASMSPPQTQPGVSSDPETDGGSGRSVKTEEEESWTPPLRHAQTVPPPPAGGTVLQNNQTEEEALPRTKFTGAHTNLPEEQMDINSSLDCAFPLCPPGGAVLLQDSTSRVRKQQSGISQKRPHACPLCDRRFQSHFNLETHLRIHTGERPFSCPVCEKTFNRKDSMTNHMKIHLGETFCCSECGKRYSDKSNLRRHALSMHAGKGHLTRPTAELESQDMLRKEIT